MTDTCFNQLPISDFFRIRTEGASEVLVFQLNPVVYHPSLTIKDTELPLLSLSRDIPLCVSIFLIVLFVLQ